MKIEFGLGLCSALLQINSSQLNSFHVWIGHPFYCRGARGGAGWRCGDVEELFWRKVTESTIMPWPVRTDAGFHCMIRLETSVRTGIDNNQLYEVPPQERIKDTLVRKRHRYAIPRTEMSVLYNCHGLTFASHRTRILEAQDVQRILQDDKWQPVPPNDLLPGDIVVYYGEDGDANHSGIVVQLDPMNVPIICSKWGFSGEFVHKLNDVPNLYGPITKFYRCRL